MKEINKVEEFAPEVLIYLQRVKDFFRADKEAKTYFIIDNDEDFFYHHVKEISQKNFLDSGEPSLSQMQFELIRKTMILLAISKKDFKEPKDEGVFEDLGDYGRFCLN